MNDINDYCIAIPTFSKRRVYIKNLIESIRAQSDIDIYLCVNCDYNDKFDEDYRKYILDLSLQYKNVYLTFYLKFRGLTKMWNDAIINGCKKYTCIMNDDSVVLDGFIDELISYHQSIDDKSILKVNNGWACFVVSKEYLETYGFFNEYYIGIGFEDCDFVSRNGDKQGYVNNKFVDLAHEAESYNSFPSNDNIQSQHQKKYSSFNQSMFNDKTGPAYVNPRPCEQFYTEKYNLIFG